LSHPETVNRESGIESAIGVGSGDLLGGKLVISLSGLCSTWNETISHSSGADLM